MKLAEYLLYIPLALAFAHAAYTDWSRREIDNRAVLVMLLCGVAACFLPGSPWKLQTLCALGMTVFCCILWCKRQDKPGGGDTKLLPVLILWLGPNDLLFVLLMTVAMIGCASLCGGKLERLPLASWLFLGWLVSLPLL